MTGFGVLLLLAACHRTPRGLAPLAKHHHNAGQRSCGGCQDTLQNGCIMVLGAAADRVGVTVPRVCDPSCCPAGVAAFHDSGSPAYVRLSGDQYCPEQPGEQAAVAAVFKQQCVRITADQAVVLDVALDVSISNRAYVITD